MEVFRSISDRIWLPHQAALEYQRNRLSVIAEQVSKYSDVKTILKNTEANLAKNLEDLQLEKRHSAISTNSLTDEISGAIRKFREELEELEKHQPNVHQEDEIREQIDRLFADKIGDPPESQERLNMIFKEGELRYKYHCPPGYMDAVKSKETAQTFLHNGLFYQKEYGDLVLWYQIIAQAKDHDLKYIIFITDDEKEDWWWKQDSNGEKTLGVRPELVEEIKQKAGVTLFYMYSSRRFIERAKSQLKVEVKDKSIEQIRDINRLAKNRQVLQKEALALHAVIRWIERNGYLVVPYRGIVDGNLDIIAIDSDTKARIGYDIKYLSTNRLALDRIRRMAHRAYHLINDVGVDRIVFIFIVDSWEECTKLSNRLSEILYVLSLNLDKITFEIGVLSYDANTGTAEFDNAKG